MKTILRFQAHKTAKLFQQYANDCHLKAKTKPTKFSKPNSKPREYHVILDSSTEFDNAVIFEIQGFYLRYYKLISEHQCTRKLFQDMEDYALAVERYWQDASSVPSNNDYLVND